MSDLMPCGHPHSASVRDPETGQFFCSVCEGDKTPCPDDRSTEERFRTIYTRLMSQAISKNRAYGDSMLHPMGLFGSGRAKDAIGARIDDKISRFKNHHGAFGENDVEDLIGYLVGWLLADEDEKGEG